MRKVRGAFCFVAGVFLLVSVFPSLSQASSPSTPPVDFPRPLPAESAFASPVVFPGQLSKGGPEKYREGELLVKFKQGVAKSKQQNLHEKHGSSKLKEFKKIRVQLVKIKKGLSVEEAIQKYKSDPSVEYAEPNYVVSINALPNDLHFGELWGLHNTGQTGGTPDANIDAPEAWGICTGNPGLVVAVIDTGIDYNHEDLAVNMWTNPAEAAGDANGDGYPGVARVDDDNDGLIDEDAQDNSRYLADGVTPNPAWVNNLINDDDENGYADDFHGIDTYNHDSDPADDHGHGTHCAGTIGADGNNLIGVAGVNWDIQVLACKFLGGGGSGYIDDAVTCLEYISDQKDRGINVVATSNSWSCGGSMDCYSQALYDAIQEQMQKDILFIAAAGNSGVDNDSYDNYPSDYKLPNVIAVAATDHNDDRAYFSNYGRRSVHVGAPGVDIVSLRAAGTDMYGDGIHFIPTGDPDAKYYRSSGTSMAAPHVAGLAGLVQSQDPGFDWWEIKNLILAGGDTVASLEQKTITGRRINAYDSLTCVDSPVFSILEYPSQLEVGVPVTLSALSINCGLPVGPVTVTLAGNETVTLADDGTGPDIFAGDGLFTGTLTPVRNIDRLTFSSPAGEESVVLPPLVIYTYLSEGNTAYFYNHFLEAKGGLAPYTWAITAGSLPDGLAFNNATGEISGTPATFGNSTFNLQVTDSLNSTLARNVSIGVSDHSVVESWGKSYDGGGEDSAHGIAKAPGGNLYVTGRIKNGTDWDCHLRKYDPDGVLAWSRTYDSGQGDSCSDVAVDGAENIYLSGFSGVDMPSEDFLLVKYDASGNFIWAKTYDPMPTGRFDVINWHGGRAQGIAVDGSGNIYLTGYWSGSIVDVGLSTATLTVKYQPSGDIEWVRLHEPTIAGDGALGYGISLDSGGNVYVAGQRQYYHEENGVGSHTFDVLFIKYDSAGNEIWARVSDHPSAPGTTCGYEGAYDVAADQSDNLYVAGFTCGYCYLTLRYTPSGDLVWAVNTEGSGSDHYAYGVDVDVNGDVLVTGTQYKGTDNDFRTIKYGPAGNVIWERLSSPETETAYAVTADNDGNFYLAGTYANDIRLAHH